MRFIPKLPTFSLPKNIFLALFFTASFFYCWFVVTYGMTSVYSSNADLGARLYGTYLAYLDIPGSTSPADFLGKIRKFIEMSMISGYGASHGALQFILRNLYLSGIIGDSIPITPRVYYVIYFTPGCLLVIYAFLIGRQFKSRGFGYLLATAYILSPWMAIAIRMPTYYPILAGLAHAAVYYHWTAFIQNPDRAFNRLMAPLSLGIYLTTGLDWLPFLTFFTLYIFLNGKIKIALRNWYNIFPFAIFFTQAMFFLRLYIVPDRLYGFQRWKVLFLSYPFTKLFGRMAEYDQAYHAFNFKHSFDYLFCAFGIGWFVACGTAIYTIINVAKRIKQEKAINLDTQQSFLFVLSCWLLTLTYPFLKSVDFIHFAFAIALPSLFISTYQVAQNSKHWILRRTALFSYFTILALMQYTVVFATDQTHLPSVLSQLSYARHDYKKPGMFMNDLRAMATAGFLIEKRPDLLKSNMVAMTPISATAPGDDNAFPGSPSHVGEYITGNFFRMRPHINLEIVKGIPEPFPGYMISKGGKNTDNILKYINWIILSSEITTRRTGNTFFDKRLIPGTDYYRQLLMDPDIDWIARFGENGKEFWLGEVKLDNMGQNKEYSHAPYYDAEKFASIYNEKYNRVSYLKRDLDYWIATW